MDGINDINDIYDIKMLYLTFWTCLIQLTLTIRHLPSATMNGPRICDDKDLIELCPELDLWLKPHAKLNITVTLPTIKTMDNSGQLLTISTWEVMDKLKKRVKPLKFKTLKVSKSNIEFIRFEAECDSQTNLGLIEARLNKTCLKLSGFAEALMVRTARVKIGIDLQSFKMKASDQWFCRWRFHSTRMGIVFPRQSQYEWNEARIQTRHHSLGGDCTDF